MLRLVHVSKCYSIPSHRISSSISAVSDVSLSVGPSEYVSIMGPSGCGKSTLLHLIGGLDVPSSGEIWFDNQPIHNLSSRVLSLLRQRKIGIIFQFFNLIPQLTVWENIVFPLRMLRVGTSEMNRRGRELLERTGLEDKANRMISEISGGEQQRVAIVRAVIHRPLLLLADEPTGNLDSATSRIVLDLLHEIRRTTQVTLLIVTHSQEVARWADRQIHMQDGALLDASTPLEGSTRSSSLHRF